MPKCDRKDCSKDAICTPKFLVPPLGYMTGTVQPLPVHISVLVCDEHLEDFRTHFQDNDGARMQLMQALISKNLALPDFSKIIMVKCALDDPNFLEFMRVSGQLQRLGKPVEPGDAVLIDPKSEDEALEGEK